MFQFPGGKLFVGEQCRYGRGRNTALLRSALLVAALIAPVAHAEFPMAGGNAQRTGFVDVDGPATEPTVQWARPLGVKGISDTQPIIDRKGNIYATGSPLNGKSWAGPEDPTVVLVSFTPEGEERWRYVYTWPHTEPGYQGSWSQYSGPVISGETVVIGHRFGVLRGLKRLNGEIRWERDLSAGREPITSTPVIDQAGFAYVHCRDIPTVHKINARTGEIVWTHQFVDGEPGHSSSPTLSADEKTLYIGRGVNDVSYLYAMNTETGAFKWAWSPERSQDHSFAWPIPIVGPEGTIYIQDEKFAHLYAVKDLGRIHAIQWAVHRVGTGAPRLGTATSAGYFGQYTSKETDNPVVFAMDPDGTERWTYPLDGGETGGLLVTRNGLYFGMNGTGVIYALDPATGTLMWRKQVGTATGGFSEGLTVGHDGTLYAGVDGTPDHPDEASLIALK